MNLKFLTLQLYRTNYFFAGRPIRDLLGIKRPHHCPQITLYLMRNNTIICLLENEIELMIMTDIICTNQ